MSVHLSKRRISMSVGIAAVAVATSVATAVPAGADTWLSDPGGCTNVQTAVQRDVNGYTVQIRYGTCGGRQHGWGRVINGRGDYYVVLEVDTNGDRQWDTLDTKLISSRNYTRGYPTASGSTRAFRACVIKNKTWDCAAGSPTGWW
ncbi:hypothetical protein [Sphaerisporangium dianthi]|uniref:DUF2690 domain-containing protein n=1 Tax=Sphaerisporangium dianthi TaxID=1436120 RepID=A0ABV9C9S3_9ACTN